MKKLKRSLSLLLSLAMVFVMAPVQTFAASKAISVESKEVAISKTYATEFTVPVNITDSGKGIHSFQLKFNVPEGWSIKDIKEYDKSTGKTVGNIFFNNDDPLDPLAMTNKNVNATGESYHFVTTRR